MNNTKIIKIFNSDNSNIVKIRTQNLQIMTTTTNEILKFEPMLKIPIKVDNTFFTIITFRKSISSLELITS